MNASDEHQVVDIIPSKSKLFVSKAKFIKLDQPLTNNPNMGVFVQGHASIVIQDPLRVKVLSSFLS